jgi:hypothetical protein
VFSSGTGTAYPSRAHDFTPVFSGVQKNNDQVILALLFMPFAFISQKTSNYLVSKFLYFERI